MNIQVDTRQDSGTKTPDVSTDSPASPRRLLVRDAAHTGNSDASLQLVVSEITPSCGLGIMTLVYATSLKFDQWYSSCEERGSTVVYKKLA